MYRQGELDALCGVYAVINSTKAMCDKYRHRLNREECKDLFVLLCGVLADGGFLADALVNGTTITTFHKMTRFAHNWVKEKHSTPLASVRAFRSEPSGGLSEYWSRILNHAQKFGGGSVLLGMSGKHDHWTCVRSMSDVSISLVDSYGIKVLHRDRCTVGDETARRRYVLWPTQTLLVSLKPQPTVI